MEKTLFIHLFILFTILAFISLMIYIVLSLKENNELKIEGGGVIFIGPIPIIFGSSPYIALAISIITLILIFLITTQMNQIK